jgi:hypothetical protein
VALEEGDLASTTWWTGRPVRIDEYHGVPGRIAAFVRDELRTGSSVASPIVASGGCGGTLFVHAKQTRLDLRTERRLPEPVEAATYFVVGEGLAQRGHAAHASVVKVELGAYDAILQLAIRDDGVGGAGRHRGPVSWRSLP